jgi:hypothetical protein
MNKIDIGEPWCCLSRAGLRFWSVRLVARELSLAVPGQQRQDLLHVPFGTLKDVHDHLLHPFPCND